MDSLLESLVRCAQAIRDEDLKLADSLLERIWNFDANGSEEYISRYSKYFAEALVRRAYGITSADTYFRLEQTTPILSYWMHLDRFCTDRINDAINDAVMGKKRLHLVDFYIPHLHGRDYLFWPLLNTVSCSGDRDLSIRVSVVLPPFLDEIVDVEEEKQYLIEAANRWKVRLAEDLKVVYANSLGEVDEGMLDFRRTKDEAVVVLYFFKLHKLLADEGAIEREFSKLRHLKPEIVIIQEFDASCNDSNFVKRLEESFHPFFPIFSFLESHFTQTDKYHRQIINNIVGCEGRDRIVRYQTSVQWQSRLLTAGFRPVPLISYSIRENWACRCRIDENGFLVVTDKMNRPMFFLSAWKPTECEDHNNDFVKGVFAF